MSQAAIVKEAIRLARNRVKRAIKTQGLKLNSILASDITKAVKVIIAERPAYLGYAKRNLNRKVQS